MVTREQIRNATNKALEGSRKVRITFGSRNADHTIYLLGMENAQVVELCPMDKAVLMAVRISRDWDGDRNRTLVITLGPRFDMKFFSGRMCRALDAIEAV